MLINILLFMSILLIYLHVYYHLRVNNDMEIYENKNMSKSNLEEMQNLRQPIVHYMNCEDLNNNFNLSKLLTNHSNLNLHIKKNNSPLESIDKYVEINFNSLDDVFNNDNKYFSDNNHNFLKLSKLHRFFSKYDRVLQPQLLSSKSYDLIMGKKTSTRYKYELSFRHFIYVSEGDVNIKLTPPCNKKYMNEHKDYYNFMFESSINPFLNKDKENISSLDIKLIKGQFLFIPAYWWYSFKFNNCVLLSFKYDTYMSQLSVLPDYILHFLQKQNVKKKNSNLLYKKKNTKKKKKKTKQKKEN